MGYEKQLKKELDDFEKHVKKNCSSKSEIKLAVQLEILKELKIIKILKRNE